MQDPGNNPSPMLSSGQAGIKGFGFCFVFFPIFQPLSTHDSLQLWLIENILLDWGWWERGKDRFKKNISHRDLAFKYLRALNFERI